MGEVYRARDTRLDRTVAIKVLPPDMAADPPSRERFEREARAVAALNSPAHLHAPRHRALRRDRLPGDGVRGGRDAGGAPDKGTASAGAGAGTAIEIASALDRAHRAGIVHRDIKPGNIMLTKGGRQAARLRDRESVRAGEGGRRDDRASRAGPDRAGPDRRHGAIHGAGADRGWTRRCADGHLRPRRRAVRDGDGAEGVRRRTARPA